MSSHWVINSKTRHCAHDSGMTAYFDFATTSSGALRCIGPFVPESVAGEQVAEAMRELTLILEREFLGQSEYVIWGGYDESPDFEEHRFLILGADCGFMPCIWMRASLFSGSSLQESREWHVEEPELLHKSGLVLPQTHLSVVDPALFHPKTMEHSIQTILRVRSVDDSTEKAIPMARWTPLRDRRNDRAIEISRR